MFVPPLLNRNTRFVIKIPTATDFEDNTDDTAESINQYYSYHIGFQHQDKSTGWKAMNLTSKKFKKKISRNKKLKLNKDNALYIRQNVEERKFLTKDLTEIMQNKRDGLLK